MLRPGKARRQTRPDRQLSKASQILRDKTTGLEGHSSSRYYSNLAYHVDSKVHSNIIAVLVECLKIFGGKFRHFEKTTKI